MPWQELPQSADVVVWAAVKKGHVEEGLPAILKGRVEKGPHQAGAEPEAPRQSIVQAATKARKDEAVHPVPATAMGTTSSRGLLGGKRRRRPGWVARTVVIGIRQT